MSQRYGMFVTSSRKMELLYNIPREPFLGRMIFILLNINCVQSYFILSLIIWACTGYVYRVNAKLPVDDPTKKNFRPAAVILAPVLFPLVFGGMISIFIMKAILYGLFLIAFTIVLIAFRKPFIITWLKKTATKAGNILLEINTTLLKIIYTPQLLHHNRHKKSPSRRRF